MQKKVYVFDLDGTLLDSMTIAWKRVLHGYLDERNISYPSDLIKRIVALGVNGMAKYYKEKLFVEEEEKEIYNTIIERMREQYATYIPAKPNVERLLKKLKGEGVSLNVLTAGVHSLFDPCLKRLGLDKYFDYTWATEEFTCTKSDPALYKEVAKILKVEPEDCVMVDDSIGALRPAKEAGFSTLGIYDEVSKDYEEEMRAVCDLYIYDFNELL